MKRRWLIVGFCVFLLAPVAAFLTWKPPLLDDVGFSRAVFDRQGRLLRLTLAPDQTYRLYTPLSDIPASMKEAVLLHEDQHFYIHAGVNPVSLFRAFVRTYITGGRRVGASTLTMQLARIKYRINTRTLAGKLQQIARATQMEFHYSKDALFEAYLNLASYGYNIDGVGAASFVYFHKKPQDLTLPEALTLAVLPQSPTRRRPESGNPAKPSLIEARNRLFARWLEKHQEDKKQKIFFNLPLATYGIKDLPFEAPHLAQNLLSQSSDGRITATIDLDMQHVLENILRKYVRDRRDSGLENASALLVDTKTMQVSALIGSANFHDAAIGGQVDGTRARRSPGSALKPFIYALALDQGLIHPASILSDAPVSYGSYTPDNFEKDFRGPVTARDALRLSRNIPAIGLAARLHAPDLYDFLQKSGVGGLKDRDSYGLSIVLGGAEVTPRELAALYAMLANDGVLKSLIFQLPPPQHPPANTPVSAEASFMTLDMLSDTLRPHGTGDPLKVYWKTGTSNGFHDAWTAGIFGHYALVVWVGNFDGKSNPALVGAQAAAPLFFSLIDAVQGKEPQREIIATKAENLRVRTISVCATTGDVLTPSCPIQESTWFIPGVSPIAKRDVYRSILINTESGKRACRMSDATVWRLFEVWPSDLRQTLQKAGIDKQPLPPFEEGCGAARFAFDTGDGQKPVILSPQPKIEYHARIDDTAEAVPFTASADGDVETLSWFIDTFYLGTSSPGGTLFWRPKPGLHHVRVIDDHGRASTTSLRVSFVQ